jgi:glycine reductase
MDLEVQRNIKELADRLGRDDVLVVLGSANADSAGIYAETVTMGDPTYAGPLAGVSLGLSVVHVFEHELEQEIEPAVYEAQISVIAMALDKEGIVTELKRIRALSA